MAVFAYKAMDLDAGSVAGTVIADSPRQARDDLRDRGLTVVHLDGLDAAAEASPASARGPARSPRRKAQATVLSFVRDLATLLTAGIPLLGSLETLAGQHRGAFRSSIQKLTDRVAAGVSLADAMGEQPAYFDELAVSIVQVGENTGGLETSLRRLAEFKDKAQRLRSRVTTALIYPGVVCTVGLAVSLFLMTYVVPNLLGTLKQAGRQLPAITQVVKTASDVLVNWWWAILAAGAGTVFAARAALATQRGRILGERAVLRLPMVGPLVRKETTSRIAVVLAALLRSGLQFTDAVRICRRTVRSRIFGRALEDYESAVAAGKDVAGPLAASGVFAPMVVQMLAVGQQAGNLEEMLEQLADTYDREVTTATARMIALLEPLLIVLLAILVGFIALATILPILEISNVL